MTVFVIGGGISGLYTAFLCIERNVPGERITILERSHRLGGCICTWDRGNGEYIEAGAGRFSHQHLLFRELLDFFHIEYTRVPDTKVYADRDPDGNPVDGNDVTETVLSSLPPETPKELKRQKSMALLPYLCLFHPLPDVQSVIHAYGYISEFETMNAYDAIRLLRDKGPFYVVPGGMHQVVKRLAAYLRDRGVTIHMRTGVTDLSMTCSGNIKLHLNVPGKSLYVRDNDALVLALPRHSLRKFSLLKQNLDTSELLKTVTKQPLMRIYANVPGLRLKCKLTTDHLIKYIIPIRNPHGDDLFMISYTDGRYATYWKSLADYCPKLLKSTLEIELERVFGQPFTVTNVTTHFWKDCAHAWKPGADSDVISQKIVNPLPRIFVASESYSQKQAWIEGALEQATKVASQVVNP